MIIPLGFEFNSRRLDIIEDFEEDLKIFYKRASTLILIMLIFKDFENLCIVTLTLILSILIYNLSIQRLDTMGDFEIFCIAMSTLILSILNYNLYIQLNVETTLVLFTTLLTLQIYYVWISKSVYLARHLQLYGWLFILTYASAWIIFSGVVIDYTGVISFQLNRCALMHVFLFIWLLWHFFYTFNYKFLSVVVFILAFECCDPFGDFENFCIVTSTLILGILIYNLSIQRLATMGSFEIFCIAMSMLILSILNYNLYIQLTVETTLILFTTLLTLKIYYVWINKSVYLVRHLQLCGWLFILIDAFAWIIFSSEVIDYTGVTSFQLNRCALMHVFLFIWLLWHFFYTFNYKFLSVVVFILALECCDLTRFSFTLLHYWTFMKFYMLSLWLNFSDIIFSLIFFLCTLIQS